MKVSVGVVLAMAVLLCAPPQRGAADGGQMILYSDSQHTTVTQNFPEPLAVNILDAAGQPVAGVVITMNVEAGDATFRYIAHGTVSPDGRTATTWTDAFGTTVAIITAGAMVGPVVVSVVASPDPQLSPTFTPITRSMTLTVDPPELPVGPIPDTGGTNPWIAAVAGSMLAMGFLLLGLRRRPTTLP
jgi:LPXTG-motif cell wall-anchored protein